jgi:ribosomal subunit interface protein
MQIEVTFRNLSANKEVKQYIRMYAFQYLESFEKASGMSVCIVCGKSAGRKIHHPPIFECHILCRGSHLPQAIFSQDESEDLLQAIQNSLESIKKQILKTEQKQRTKNHDKAYQEGELTWMA